MPKSSKKNYYAVVRGVAPVPAIYTSWSECQPKVHRFPGALFEGFATLAQAKQYLKARGVENVPAPTHASCSGKPYDRPPSLPKEEDDDDEVEIVERPIPIEAPPPAPAIKLSVEQNAVLERVVRGENVFFSGSAGTGKSVLLREIIDALRKKPPLSDIAVTASTGIAALNIGGCTIHSWSGIGIGQESAEKLTGKWFGQSKRFLNKYLERWRAVRTLIVDEISMLDGKIFDKLEKIARIVRGNDLPFGGIQLVISGDFFQLPPVPDRKCARTGEDSELPVVFAFESETWDLCLGPPVTLTHVFRQKARRFVDLLNAMRFGVVEPKDTYELMGLSREVEYSDGIQPTQLLSRKFEVENANQLRLSELPGEELKYVAVDLLGLNSRGFLVTQPEADRLLEKLVVRQEIFLRVGAQVMLIKNVVQGRLVNGSVGQVTRLCTAAEADKDGIVLVRDLITNEKNKRTPEEYGLARYPVVRFTTGDQVCITPLEFGVLNADGGIEAQRTQVPLILAWALSVHKSQGQTLERVKVDLGSVFEKGQAYVAISRATSMEGLQILNFNPTKVMVHPRVLAWHGAYENKRARQQAMLDEEEEMWEEYDESMFL